MMDNKSNREVSSQQKKVSNLFRRPSVNRAKTIEADVTTARSLPNDHVRWSGLTLHLANSSTKNKSLSQLMNSQQKPMKSVNRSNVNLKNDSTVTDGFTSFSSVPESNENSTVSPSIYDMERRLETLSANFCDEEKFEEMFSNLRERLMVWKRYDDKTKPKCCATSNLEESCTRCFNFKYNQVKMIDGIVENGYHSLKSLMFLPGHEREKLSKAINKMNKLDVFDNDSGKECPLALIDYLGRLVKYIQIWFNKSDFGVYNHIGINCMFLSFLYLEKLKNSSGIMISKMNVHNLLLTSFLVAAKFSEDCCISNRWWAQVGEISLQKLNELELEFCRRLQFDMSVDEKELEAFYFAHVPHLESILTKVEYELESKLQIPAKSYNPFADSDDEESI